MTASADVAAPRSLDTRDLRTGGRWTRAQAAKNALIRLVVRFAVGLADRLPPSVLLAVGRSLGGLAAAVRPSLRRRTERALREAFPNAQTSDLAGRCFRAAGENLAVCLLLRRDGRAGDWLLIEPDARRLLDAAADGGRGAVFISAHFGPFELVPAAVAELGYRTTVVVRESYDPGLDAIVDAHRTGRGTAVIHRGRPGAPARIVRALRDRQLVGFLPDLGGRLPTVPVEWLGRTTRFAVGPQQIAIRSGAPALFGVALPIPHAARGPRFRLHLVLLEHQADPAALTQRVAWELARVVQDNPEQWLWMGAPGQPIAYVST